MGNPRILLDVRETATEVCVAVKKPTMRYFDELLRCKCAADLLEFELFPNSKEVTESFAAHRAARLITAKWCRLDNPEMCVIAVGDGGTPRTAATFALRSKWDCHSVDPLLGHKTRWERIERLHLHRCKVEECDPAAIGKHSFTLLCCVHSHANFEAAVRLARKVTTQHLAAIVMPCCVVQELNGQPPDEVYADWGVWSPKREIRLWQDIPL